VTRAAALRARGDPAAHAPYRVMVVDDSAVARGLLTRALEDDGEIIVAASAGNGRTALEALRRYEVELVLLDLAMPEMDGITVLPLMLAEKPELKVIIVSSLTQNGAVMTLRALAAGAADYVAKPSSGTLAADAFRRELRAKVKALGEALRTGARRGRISRPPAAPGVLRPMPRGAPRALAIGASTGGPMALYRIFAAIDGRVHQPIFLTQHMPATFTALFAAQLARIVGIEAAEARDGELVAPGRVYVAPGNYHLEVETAGEGKRIRLSQAPPENFCRPSVDPMLRSLASAYGGAVLATMLTGMGQDGLKGAAALVAAGGAVIAQDQATSVIWGMPGAVVAGGLACAVTPLDEIGPLLVRLAGRAP
jgi:two-component system, chemotaxis family, protein-glutamate methylesterase/glutaminase